MSNWNRYKNEDYCAYSFKNMQLLFYLTLVIGYFPLLFQLATCQVPRVFFQCIAGICSFYLK